MKPHKHAEVIKAWADGAEIEYKNNGTTWACATTPTWDERVEFRIKPVAPKWPQTTMTYEQIEAAAHNAPMGAWWRGIANSALKHACEAGEVVPADKVREIEAKAREEGIKEGRSKEQELRRVEVNFGYCDNRVGAQLGQAFSQSQMEIQRQQHADAVSRGMIK